jgi:hypothetical protein
MYHNADARSMSNRGKELTKPSRVDYNRNMGAIDLKAQLLNMYLVERKRMSKWSQLRSAEFCDSI